MYISDCILWFFPCNILSTLILYIWTEIVANDEEQLVELMEFVEDLEEIINETFTGLSSEANFQVKYINQFFQVKIFLIKSMIKIL